MREWRSAGSHTLRHVPDPRIVTQQYGFPFLAEQLYGITFVEGLRLEAHKDWLWVLLSLCLLAPADDVGLGPVPVLAPSQNVGVFGRHDLACRLPLKIRKVPVEKCF